MIQTKHNTLYLCEMKFKKNRIESDILSEMKQKIADLKVPKNFSIRPVLIHVNGIDDTVVESDFFSHTIDFGQMLA